MFKKILARAPGFEPRPKVLETLVLPLYYARVYYQKSFGDANIDSFSNLHKPKQQNKVNILFGNIFLLLS